MNALDGILYLLIASGLDGVVGIGYVRVALDWLLSRLVKGSKQIK